MDPRRTERVAETLKHELEELINYELDDPRIGSVTVTEVVISPDMRHAHVRLALEGSAEEKAATLAAVDHAGPFLRHRIAERLDMFRTPDFRFFSDLPAAFKNRGESLLRRIRKGRPRE